MARLLSTLEFAVLVHKAKNQKIKSAHYQQDSWASCQSVCW